MQTPLLVRLGASCASAVITLALLQSIALLGHPRPAADSHVAQTAPTTAPAR